MPSHGICLFATTTAAPNPAYDAWLTRDQQVLSYLLGALSPEILLQAVGLEHAADVWSLVNNLFASRSKANVSHLRGALSNTKKLNMTADQYIAKMRGFATELVAAGRTIEEDELVDLILNGLDEDYNGLVASVNAMTTPCSVSDFHGLLSAFDTRQNMLSGGNAQKRFESSANSASRGCDRRDGYYKKNYQGHGRPRGREEERGRDGGGGRRPPQGGRGRGRGGYTPPPRPRDDIPCQICKKDGHSAPTCWWRYSDNDNNNDSYERGANAAYGVDTNWYSDTGATDHITGNLEKLMVRDAYHGKDKIHTANGEGNLEKNDQRVSQNSEETQRYFMSEETAEPAGSGSEAVWQRQSRNGILLVINARGQRTFHHSHVRFERAQRHANRVANNLRRSRVALAPIPLVHNITGQRRARTWPRKWGHARYRVVHAWGSVAHASSGQPHACDVPVSSGSRRARSPRARCWINRTSRARGRIFCASAPCITSCGTHTAPKGN
ncbi:hypothetical protein QYE76_029818 [Lolium multiflorum]|uniref:Retrotransposon protein, putative, Ty1-copia subclass n=1 Tax=Lolium multiflorum TaxID=4521 RepID=A0AAD8QPP1_LOLMU|nr:hypothetical protein QYE76_029818 [Lolium multiflorum]